MARLLISMLVAAAVTALAGAQPEAVKPAPLTPGGQPTGAQPSGEVKPKPKAPLYDVDADAKLQIAAAVAKAKKENRRVLVQWGGNWCPWCIRLAEVMKSNRGLSHELLYEYDVVHVDAGQPKDKNMDLAASYGADVKTHGFPFLTVLDADGKPIANQETEALEVKGADGKSVGVKAGHDAKKVLEFLKANEAKPLAAQSVVDAGIAEAKSSGKLVFLHFGAPWCPWCHRLDDWMDKAEPAALLGKGFVNIKVDVDRMTGGKEILAKYRPKDGGIPWFAFIDGDGKVVADSDAAQGGNVGFPSSKEELAHFSAMLAKATKLSDEDRTKLIESLKSDKPASAGGGH